MYDFDRRAALRPSKDIRVGDYVCRVGIVKSCRSYATTEGIVNEFEIENRKTKLVIHAASERWVIPRR